MTDDLVRILMCGHLACKEEARDRYLNLEANPVLYTPHSPRTAV